MQPDSTLIQGTKGGIGEGELDGMEESHKGGTKTNYWQREIANELDHRAVMGDGKNLVERGEGFWVIRRGMRQRWIVVINRDFNAAETASGVGTRAATYYITVPKRFKQ